jgi:hypothetical protein
MIVGRLLLWLAARVGIGLIVVVFLLFVAWFFRKYA